MLRNILIIILLAASTASAKDSQILTDSINSHILGCKRAYDVYLPANYDANRHYPILYLLHGKDGGNHDWQKSGHLKAIADSLIANGQATPMIIVTPDAGEKNSPGRFGYFDFPGWNYEQFFFKEFMPQVEQRYNAGGTKGQRAIAGLSMGGGGATAYALHHPEMFAAVYAMSSLMDLPAGRKIGKNDNFNKSVKEQSCVLYVQHADADSHQKLCTVQWYIDCGDDDFLFDPNIDFYRAMKAAKVPAELRIRDGNHNWAYWRSAFTTCLPYVSAAYK